MDAKDRLRRYLEQRREMGESELVLDSLSVDDVMSMVGVKTRVGASRDSARPSASERATPTPSDPEMPAAPVISAPLQPPPKPEVRFDRGATTDWREALRNAEAGKSTAHTEPPASGASSVGTLPAWLAALDLPAGLASGRLGGRDAASDIASLPSLEDVARHINQCTRCALHHASTHPVPGEGSVSAEVMCIGEAPGPADEEHGGPFGGEAGDLLVKILGAIQLSRTDVFMGTLLKHRPPGNREPLPDELAACQPYLLRQLELVRPRVVLALGRIAAQTLLQTSVSIAELRGRVHLLHGVPLIVTYHPATLLLNESWKRPTWEDVKLVRRILDASRAERADTTGQ
jgi:uracil-DNA glycosylase family 4